MNRNNRVAGSVHFGWIWVAGTVIEEADDSLGSFMGAVGFGSGKIVEGVHHGVVQGSCNVKGFSSDRSRRLVWSGVRCGEVSTVVNCCLAPY